MENVKKEEISSLAKNAVKKLSSSRCKITASEVCHISVLSFTFRFLSSPPLLLFLPRFFFCWAFTRPFFGGKSFCVSYCVWGSYDYTERKVGGYIVKQDCHVHFRVNIAWFFLFLRPSRVNRAHWGHGLKDLFPLPKKDDKVVLDHKSGLRHER